MRIAVAEFQERVAPRLEQTESFVLFDIEGGRVVGRKALRIDSVSFWDTVDFLKKHGVDLVLCGALLPQSFHLLHFAGIGVIWGVIGGIDEAISSFLAGGFPYPPPARKRWRWGKRKKWR